MSAIVEALLAGVFDYAGLFPPASLSMAGAINRYAAARRSREAWLLGRFIVPASRLPELDALLHDAQPEAPALSPGARWRVSAIVGADVAADADAIARFNRRQPQARSAWPTVDAVEVKAAAPDDIASLAAAFAAVPAIWIEVAPAASLDGTLRAIAAAGAGAKLRTGGVSAAAFPEPALVARFLLASAVAGVRFKATAGLHHAWRGRHPLTYAADSPSAIMHGFLNLLLASTLARGFKRGDDGAVAEAALTALLDEGAADAVVWEEESVRWRDHLFGLDDVRDARASFAQSFGSCSFDEPVGELQARRLIAAPQMA